MCARSARDCARGALVASPRAEHRGKSDAEQSTEQRAGDVVDDVGDVARPVEAGQLELGPLDRDRVRRQPGQPDRAITQDHRSRRAARITAGHQGTKTARLSKRWPPEKIQKPSGAGPPMSHEQVSSRSSAETMPGAPLAGIKVISPITTTDQTRSPSTTAPGRPIRPRDAATSARQTSPDRATPTSITPTPPTGNMATTLPRAARPLRRAPGSGRGRG